MQGNSRSAISLCRRYRHAATRRIDAPADEIVHNKDYRDRADDGINYSNIIFGAGTMTPAIALALTLAGVAVAALVIVVARAGGGASSELSHALAQLGVVRLKELERSWRGRTDEARIELLRQLLEEARSSRAWRWPGRRKPMVLVGASLLALLLCGLTLFSLVDEPAATPRVGDAMGSLPQDPDLARLELYAKAKAPRPAANATPAKAQELPDVETMIERLALRLQKKPDDAQGWRMLGWSYLSVQQPAKAVEAYARAATLEPQSAALKAAYGEAIVAAENGTVTPQAVETFNAALALEAKNPKARYFVALALDQSGKKKEALDGWLSLLAEPMDDEPWVAELRQRAQSLARELGVTLPTQPVLAAQGSGESAGAGAGKLEAKPGHGPRPLTAEELRLAQALPADQQQAMIRSMVSSLADRLESKPRDEEGWMRLIRSRVVLGEEGAAREALARALVVFADDASAGGRIAATAKELGLSNN
jgi:cytochrome c-type biogenesis protein CcmH